MQDTKGDFTGRMMMMLVLVVQQQYIKCAQKNLHPLISTIKRQTGDFTGRI